MNINPKQLQLIHIAKSQLNIDDETYKETLLAKFNVRSSKELTYYQATLFLDHLKRAGFKIKRKKTTVKMGSKVITMATAAQRALIEVLKANIVWKVSYQAWLEKRMKIKKIVTCAEAFKVIEGLKGMLKITTPIIAMKALPFPYTPELKLFINKKTGEIQKFCWMFDTKSSRLICFNVHGEEEECLTSANT